MVQNPFLKKQDTTDYVHKLELACKWSYYASYEIVELFELWETRIKRVPWARGQDTPGLQAWSGLARK